MKRILVVYATAGTGHKKAAYAIKKALGILGKEKAIEVEVIDSLDYMSPFFRWSYPRMYIFMVNRMAYLWSIGYYLSDNKLFYGFLSWIRHLTNWINGRRLAGYLRKKEFDVIISTHFLAPDIISMEGKRRVGAFLINVVTDFRLHSFWVANGVDIYTVAHTKTKADLVSKYKIPEKKINIVGIPIDPVFSEKKDKREIASRLKVERGLFTVLIGSGGFGVGPIVDLVKSFKGISIPIQLLVVCGRNESLRASVEGLRGYIGIPITPYGFIDNMDELMEISDVIVTKTGGMMSSESLSKGLPIICIAPIPGQETRNFAVLKESGVAIEAKRAGDVPRIIAELYNDRERIGQMRRKVAFVKKAHAAFDVARIALGALR